MSARVYRTTSEEETIELGRKLAKQLPRPSVVLLTGNLGAGKTTLSKGIAEGLGATSADDVSSPTFTLIHEYGKRLYHVDLYRLDKPAQVSSLGLDDLFDSDSIVLIEWGERFRDVLPRNAIEITIEARGDERTITAAGLSI